MIERQIAEAIRLLVGNNEPAARAVGARELLRMDAPAAWDRLAAVLRSSGDPAAQVAVCQGIVESPVCREVLIDPLVELLGADAPATRRAAAAALARCGGSAVIERLSRLARQPATPPARRLGAIEALGALGDDKSAIAALIELLDDANSEIIASALDKIDDSSDVDLIDPSAARAWWAENRDLDSSSWLRRRNQQLRTRVERSAAGSTVLTTRLLAALRAAYAAAPESDKDKLLLDYLNDPLPEVRALGVDLIDARITDRKPVSGEMTARVESLITDSNVAVRRGAIAVLGDLRDRNRIGALLAALRRETSSPVRAAIVSALGRIGGPAAASAVQGALNDPSPTVQADAALALASLAEPGVAAPEIVASAADALEARYIILLAAGRPNSAGGTSDPAADAGARDFDFLREAFLNAMARVRAVRFRPHFQSALDEAPARSGTAPVRRAAIRGLVATDDGSAAARLRPLLSDADPSIRAAAAEAIGKCGGGDDDLAALFDRLDPAREPEEAGRQRAWESLRSLLVRRSAEQQWEWAERVGRRGDPAALERSIDLLSLVERRLVEPSNRAANGSASAPADAAAGIQRADVLERLAEANLALGRPAVAASWFEQEAQWLAAGGRTTTAPTATRDATRRPRGASAAAEARRQMVRAADALLRARRYDALPAMLERNRTINADDGLIDHVEVGRLLAHAVDECLADPDSATALELIHALDQILEADSLFPRAVQQSLTELRTRQRGLSTSTAPADENVEP